MVDLNLNSPLKIYFKPLTRISSLFSTCWRIPAASTDWTSDGQNRVKHSLSQVKPCLAHFQMNTVFYSRLTIIAKRLSQILKVLKDLSLQVILPTSTWKISWYMQPDPKNENCFSFTTWSNVNSTSYNI